MSKSLSVTEAFVKQAHGAACTEWKQKIENEFPNLFPKKLTERVKTWEDILELSGKNENEVLPYRNPRTKQEKSQNAFAKIQLISEVLNEGWEPNFSNSNEYKYYPYFEKKSSRWVVYYHHCVRSLAALGCEAYYKSSELALFAGNTFLDVYKEYLPN